MCMWPSTGRCRPQASEAEAVDAYRRRGALWRTRPNDFAPAETLGYLGPRYLVGSPRDELVVLAESVSVIDGVLRGLAQNHSETLWARNAAVAATDSYGARGLWRFPLSVQPGEAMPFEIEHWEGTESPAEISFEVTADLSPTIDLTRSLEVRVRRIYVLDEEFERFPEYWTAGGAPGRYFGVTEMSLHRRTPTSHPKLAEAAGGQTVENVWQCSRRPTTAPRERCWTCTTSSPWQPCRRSTPSGLKSTPSRQRTPTTTASS